MNKRIWLIVAILILIPTAVLFLLSWWVQPLLPSPWNNALIILGVVIAAVLAGLSGITDTLHLAERLLSRKKPPEEADRGRTVQVTGQADLVIAGDENVVLILQQASQAFLATLSRPGPELPEASRRYLEFLLDRYRNLDFRGMGVSDRLPLRLELLEMYVPLKALIQLPEGETWARELRLAGRPLSEEETAAVGERVSEKPVLELLQAHPGLIILGDPGAGKTTFMKYLTLQLALGQGAALGLGPRLPVLLPLSDYANALSGGNIPLDEYVVTYYRQAVGDEFPVERLLAAALTEGRALILLDGLDEVRQEHLRRTVVDRVEDFFALQKRRGNKVVLTSRLVGYKEMRPAVDGLQECTLMDFGDEEIAQFAYQWTGAVARAAHGRTEQAVFDAAQEETDLLAAIHKNPGVYRLATNPLMLTILAVMKRQDVVLPERRVELYEQYVKTMLKHWNLARGLGQRPARDLDVVETVRVLAPLALWMHETSPGKGLVKEGAMLRQLTAIYRARGAAEPDQAARRLLTDTRRETAMLVERGSGQYGFIHLTFQEYLAAIGIVQKGQLGIGPVVTALAARIDDPDWHEVIQLAIGYLGIVQGYEDAASQVVQQLLKQKPGTAGQVEILMGMSANDVGEHGLTHACREAITQAVLTALRDDGRVAPRQRALAGQTLARLGDPRPEVVDLDAMTFCYVPPGPFWLGSDTGRDNEKPQHWLALPAGNWLGQWPVTQAQYGLFVAAGGYAAGEESWWREARERDYWRKGRGFKGLFDSEYRQGAAVTNEPYTLANHPVVGVSWYEALAFCRWLTARWQAQGWLPQGWQVTLPSEAEWEKGARGGAEVPVEPLVRPVTALAPLLARPPQVAQRANPGAQAVFTWGDRPDPNRANSKETGIGTTSAVGCFPGGVSLYGAAEMLGNVWEWTRSKYAGYEYQAGDGREQLDASDDGRVLRGGSWYFGHDALRCASRVRGIPPYGSGGYGFRVCVSPFPATSGR